MVTRPPWLLVLFALVAGVAATAWWLWDRAEPASSVGDPAAVAPYESLEPDRTTTLPGRETATAAPQVLPIETPDGGVEVAFASHPAVRAFDFSGRVVDAGGRPVPGAGLWILTPSRVDAGWPTSPGLRAPVPGKVPGMVAGRRPIRELDLRNDLPLAEQAHTRSDAEGRFRIGADDLAWAERVSRGGVPAHTPGWSLVVSATGFATRVLDLPVGLEDTLPVGDVLLEPGLRLAGRVLDAEDRPVVDAVVCPRMQLVQPARVALAAGLSRLVLPELAGGRTDDEGRFELVGLWGGELSVVVEHADHPTHVEHLVLRTGEHMEVTLRLAVAQRLVGTVQDPDGQPVHGATIVALPHAEDRSPSAWRAAHAAVASRAPSTTAQADGRFVLTAAPDGALSIVAWAAAHEPTRLAPVTPGGGPLRIWLQPETGRLVRCVDAETGARLPGARIVAERGDERPVPLPVETTDEAGATHRVRGTGAVERTTLLATCDGYAPLTTRLWEDVTPREVVVELALPRGVELAGHVRTAAGLPVAGATVEAWGSLVEVYDGESRRHALTTSDGEGRFRLASLAPDTWTLTAAGVRFARSPELTVELGSAGARRDDLELVVEHGATLTCRVLDGERPVAWREAVALSRIDEQGRRRSPFIGMTQTDGVFRIDGLEAGRYHVHAPSVGSAFAGLELELAAGEIRQATLRLPARPVVHGRVAAGDRAAVGLVVHARAIESEMNASNSAGTDARGRYRLVLPGPGTWSVAADVPGTPARPGPAEHAREVTVGWGEEHALDLELPQP